MAYPWYSTGRRMAGPSHMLAVSTDENCNTKQIRYRAEWIDPNVRQNMKGMSDTSLDTLQSKVSAYLQAHGLHEQLSDLRDVVSRLA